VDVDTLAQDDAGAEKADAGNDLSGDAGPTILTRLHRREDHEPRRAQRHAGVGAQPGHLLMPLSLEPDRRSQQRSKGESERMVRGSERVSTIVRRSLPAMRVA
jgi:hypothetical protein